METLFPAASTASTTSTAPDVGYVHGYSTREAARLGDQADVLAGLLHSGTRYPDGSRVLEIGCGVGAQTRHLVAHSPGARLVAVDRSAESLAIARARLAEHAPGAFVEWHRADVHALPFAEGEFDHVFVCFVLEHLADPAGALERLRRVLRPGGSLTVIEGDHGSVLFHPDSAPARAAIDCQARLQAAAGGDASLGRRLLPLLDAAGFTEARVRPCTVYADRTREDLRAGFTRDTFVAAIASVRAEALAAGLTTPDEWDLGIEELRRTAVGEGTFHYTFFKAVARRPER
ncbi:Methyltransferase domain-containing protein [Streptomyces zhaozhouensis]|uniref:Methyltransferase domain-containing protein n=1 Tax=Streptomyces zhaozhouensis TaxID=1300267 RepID=A0A286DYR8_9ACTN|nr:methyltransferase domain-containing protein [Streptomyces zhaozhouensis]SOD63780.1 Methyltransferase domain-containing protein [Streptomyces zhaozhouensis]